jgi:hypothetical protein
MLFLYILLIRLAAPARLRLDAADHEDLDEEGINSCFPLAFRHSLSSFKLSMPKEAFLLGFSCLIQ